MDSGGKFSPKDLQAMLQSSAGQQLIKLLNEKDGTALKKAAEAAQKGQYNKAIETLAPLLKDTDASKLASKLRENYG